MTGQETHQQLKGQTLLKKPQLKWDDDPQVWLPPAAAYAEPHRKPTGTHTATLRQQRGETERKPEDWQSMTKNCKFHTDDRTISNFASVGLSPTGSWDRNDFSILLLQHPNFFEVEFKMSWYFFYWNRKCLTCLCMCFLCSTVDKTWVCERGGRHG